MPAGGSRDVAGWAAVLWLPAIVGGLGLAVLLSGLRSAEDEQAVREAAVAFLRDVQAMDLPDQKGGPPLAADLRSVRLDGDTALVRVTLRDGEHFLRVNVRLRRVRGLWRGEAIDLPDMAGRDRNGWRTSASTPE